MSTPAVSDDNPPVHQAWAAVMGDVQALAKGDKSNHGGFSFRGVDAVVNAVGPALRAHGVIVMPVGSNAVLRDVTTGKGKPAQECVLEVTYRVVGPAGDHLDLQVVAESIDHGDKAIAQAWSVALRTLYLQSLTIPTGDADPDHTVHERSAPAQQQDPRLVGYEPDGHRWQEALTYYRRFPDEVREEIDQAVYDKAKTSIDELPDDGWRRYIGEHLMKKAQELLEPFDVDKPSETDQSAAETEQPESYPPGQEPFDTPEEAA